jgi:predicted GIY-YIG superfamily endonuclease
MVYLLHFSTPLAHAQHYIGSADDVEARLARHNAGHGARITQVAKEQGIELTVARTWEGGRKEERRLKNRKNAPKLCPICETLKKEK